MRKSSLPIKPGFRTAAEAALVELREHVRLGALVEHEAQIAGSALRLRQSREQSRIEFRGKTVQAVGDRAEAEPLQVVDLLRNGTHSLPIRAVEEDEQILRLHVDEPSGMRCEEPPGAEIEQRDMAGLAGEGAGGVRADEVAVAFRGRGRRRIAAALLDGKLHERIESGERLVVGDMLLRLRRGDERQSEMGCR